MTDELRLELPERQGERPGTTRDVAQWPIAHEQKTQNAPVELQEKLFERAQGLAGVRIGASFVSVPGARAFHLDPQDAKGPEDAFRMRSEFGHLHPPYDGSLHMTLPPQARQEVLDKGWGEPHPHANTTMVYGPRDDAELEIVWQILQVSHAWAFGGGSG